ncbi:unnamed protein product [Plutella xylostella]|uniref:(diamondback moth) hypothetical protein n=1 Tax=Plutella xylostella TaxID=51655 RepID=A0A8S4CW72_PLUXY|nr:unnamed protein product [Plutella xylostella]
MAKLCQSQRLLSERIAKLLTNTKKTPKTRYTEGYIETRMETLEGYWTLFNTQYNEINNTVTDEVLAEIRLDIHENFDTAEEAYLELKTLLKDCLIELTKKDTQQCSTENAANNDTTSIKRTKLPPIPIPTFSGNYNDWMSYRYLFIALIHNDTELSKIEKHHYLKSSLTGEAQQLLKHFSLTDANYDAAWKTLEDRYNNKRIIVNTILNRLLNQKKISNECVRSTKDLLDTTKECLNSLQNLQIDTCSWDAIIVHIVVAKLDMESHKLWEQSLGSSTDIATFTQLSAYLETRFRSMEMMSKSVHTTTTTNTKGYIRKIICH